LIDAVAFGGLAGAQIELDAAETLLELQIDHARDRIRAIGGGGAAGDDLDAFDQRTGNDVQIDRAVAARGLHASSVDEHQGPLLAEATQVDAGLACTRNETGL
jgi:hypothetical protein